MSKFRILAGLLALAAVGAVAYVRASNAGDAVTTTPAADTASCDSCCGPVVPEPVKAEMPATLPDPFTAQPDKDAAPTHS